MKPLKFGNGPLLMGILNITPDSFYDGGKYIEKDKVKKRVETLLAEGADIIDIGGESSRPGAEPVSLEVELNRIKYAIELPELSKVPVSIDTYKAKVAEEALKRGASIVNDISGLRFDSDMVYVIRDFNAYVIIMHMKGTPKNMQMNPEYKNVVSEIKDFFKERIDFALSHGIKEEKIILDPGIGFGKKQEHNIDILIHLDEFKKLGYPLLIGHSRKSLIGYLTGKKSPDDRLWATLALSSYLIIKNIDIIRVHDVAPHRDLLKTLKPFINIDNSGLVT